MEEQLNYHGFWPVPMRALAQLTEWMDWMRPFLYCLLVVAVVALVLTLLDLGLLLSQESWQANESKSKSSPAEPAFSDDLVAGIDA